MAEGGGLLNRYRVKSSIGGSNPPLSASKSTRNFYPLFTLRLLREAPFSEKPIVHSFDRLYPRSVL